MKRAQIDEAVASVAYVWIDASGAERPLKGIVGKPYPVGDQWSCPYVLEGGLEQGQDVAGGDSVQALSLALYGLYHDLLRLLGDGGRLLNPTTREPFDLVTLKATFSRSTSQFQSVS
ncbi:MAG TPA: hypothetical protein VN903_24215 [Polyangia bacterium]|jgi:hypothetical protein|nr:hypothetical protein [Polyangia bacterium]